MHDKPDDDPGLLYDGPADARWTLILAHGAGQGMDSPFMETVAQTAGRAGLRVVRFDFPYMTRMRLSGRRRPPDREPVLRARWNEAIEHLLADGVASGQLIIGGKSMGGRMASLIADEREAAGLICLGYPFHPPGKPDQLRVEHLTDLRTPALICQGTRDPFGNRQEVGGYPLSQGIRLAWIEDGEHSFKPRKHSGRTWEQNLEQAAAAIVSFAASLKTRA
jgi:predicted alpha/beta-hydrolase family hydrolase